MTTEEWVSADNEIWGFDYNDDFIWLPSAVDGVGIWVAKTEAFTYVANKEAFTYVAEKEVFTYDAKKADGYL